MSSVPEVYADTVSAINFNNGNVKFFLVDQDPEEVVKAEKDPSEMTPRMKQQVIMPLPGFLYMTSLILNLIEDPKMQALVEKYVELGLLPEGTRIGKTKPVADTDPSS